MTQAETMRKKWQDPEWRARVLAKMEIKRTSGVRHAYGELKAERDERRKRRDRKREEREQRKIERYRKHELHEQCSKMLDKVIHEAVGGKGVTLQDVGFLRCTHCGTLHMPQHIDPITGWCESCESSFEKCGTSLVQMRRML